MHHSPDCCSSGGFLARAPSLLRHLHLCALVDSQVLWCFAPWAPSPPRAEVEQQEAKAHRKRAALIKGELIYRCTARGCEIGSGCLSRLDTISFIECVSRPLAHLVSLPLTHLLTDLSLRNKQINNVISEGSLDKTAAGFGWLQVLCFICCWCRTASYRWIFWTLGVQKGFLIQTGVLMQTSRSSAFHLGLIGKDTLVFLKER